MIRTISRGYRRMATAASILAISVVLAPAAHASGSSMPWEQPLQQILQSIEGPVAKIVAVIIIIATGLTLAFGDTSGGFRRLIQIVFGLSHRLRGVELLPVVLLVRRRGARLMAGGLEQLDAVPGFSIPVHRALTEHILLGGAPRSIAIMNGTLAGAVGLGLRLWLVGIAIWAIGHFAAVWAAKRDPQFVEVGRRHIRIPAFLAV
ncbi:hypothetical protein MASR1M32_35300 [Rhodobacter sp.]